eukprot:gene13610-28907_t
MCDKPAIFDMEQNLLDWTTLKCKDSSKVTFEEGWDIILKYGIERLQIILLDSHFEGRPFGMKIIEIMGFASSALTNTGYDLQHTASKIPKDLSVYIRDFESPFLE